MRLETADRLKFLCIVLVIIGHCQISATLHDAIYLFHIPMFFFLSGCFFKECSVVDRLRKDSRSLLIAYVVGILLVSLKYAVDGFRLSDFSTLIQYGKIQFWDAGPLWFLLSLFWCRGCYNLFSKIRYSTWIAIIFSFLICSFSFEIILPLGIQQGILGLCFYGVGHQFFNAKTVHGKKWLSVPSLALALVAIWIPSIDMHAGLFPIPVLSELTSLGAIIFLWMLTYTLEGKSWKWLKGISYCGRMSLLILVVHYYEAMTFDFYGHLGFMPNPLIVVMRVVADIGIAVILSRIPAVRRLLCLK